MKYTALALLLCSFFFFTTTQASALNWVDNNGAKNCNSDPLDDSSGQKRIPVSNNFSASASGSTACAFHGYYSGEWSTWQNLGSDDPGNHYSCPDQGYASQIEYNGTNTQYRVYCKYRDDTPPDPSTDVVSYLPNVANRLATSGEEFLINIDNGGEAPISLIQGFFERNDLDNLYYSISSDGDQNPGNLSQLRITDWDIHNVDNDGSVNNGKRTYKVFISYIEDEAGNSVGTIDNNNPASALLEYDYLVFANTLNIGTKTASTDLDSNLNVADGTQKNIDISLRDIYGNKIIPVGDISRTIDFEVNTDNFIRKNQYINSGNDSGVYIDSLSNAIAIGGSQINTLSSRSSNSGDYNIPIYVFAPTHDNNSLAPGDGGINSIELDINGSLGQNTDILIDNSSIVIRSRPLFTSQFSGNIVDQGFIEGLNQSSNLDITKDSGSSVSVLNPSVRLEFGTGTLNQENLDYNLSVNTIDPVAEGLQAFWFNTSEISGAFSNTALSSFMTQERSVTGSNRSYLASILKYSINIGGTNENIIYPSGIVGKNAYWGTINTEDNSFQTGVRISGNTSSQTTGEITTGQFDGDVRIIGELVKSTLRKDIEQQVYTVIRGIDAKTSGTLTVSQSDINSSDWSSVSSASRGLSIFGNKVLYFGDVGASSIVLEGSNNIEGEKTIVVESGNIYITENILNGDSDGMLGVIALDGNIYIDPSVTDLEAILYTNKSIISYNGVELDGNNSSSGDIANQLYIHGSIFSENTIGGSRKSIPECPYYVNTSCNTLQEAQKYDLNYLRRYFIYDSNDNGTVEFTIDIPANSGLRSIGGAVGSGFEQYPVIIDYNPAIQQNPPPFFD